MIQGATEGCISPTLGIQKLGMAALASFHRIELEQQVAQMTAAKRHKAIAANAISIKLAVNLVHFMSLKHVKQSKNVKIKMRPKRRVLKS